MSRVDDDGAIQRSARRLRIVVIAVMIAMAGALALAWSGVRLGSARAQVAAQFGQDRNWTAITIVLLEIALFQLTRMLRSMERGGLFSAEVVRHFRAFALWLLLVAAGSLAGSLIGSLVHQGRMADGGHVRMTIEMSDVVTLGVTLLLFLLARLLERARNIEDEMREFV